MVKAHSNPLEIVESEKPASLFVVYVPYNADIECWECSLLGVSSYPWLLPRSMCSGDLGSNGGSRDFSD